MPRFIDEDTGVPYELLWKCTKCGWAIQVNNYQVGKDICRLCASPTKLLRVDYKYLKTRDIIDVLN